MTFGLWIGPVGLAGLCVFLCLATWLERLVPPPAGDGTRSARVVGSPFTGTTSAESLALEPERAERGIAAA
jgi:hypothetical protein